MEVSPPRNLQALLRFPLRARNHASSFPSPCSRSRSSGCDWNQERGRRSATVSTKNLDDDWRANRDQTTSQPSTGLVHHTVSQISTRPRISNNGRGWSDSRRTSRSPRPPSSGRYNSPFPLPARLWSTGALAPGTIIHGEHVCESPASGPNITKYRMMVVVRVVDSHFTCVGIYTNGGTGIRHVPKQDKQYYMSIKDHRTDKCEQQIFERPVLRTGEMVQGSTVIAPNAMVMFSAENTKWFCHEFSILGRLTALSTADLLEQVLRKRYAPGQEPNSNDPEFVRRCEDTLQLARRNQLDVEGRSRRNSAYKRHIDLSSNSDSDTENTRREDESWQSRRIGRASSGLRQATTRSWSTVGYHALLDQDDTDSSE